MHVITSKSVFMHRVEPTTATKIHIVAMIMDEHCRLFNPGSGVQPAAKGNSNSWLFPMATEQH